MSAMLMRFARQIGCQGFEWFCKGLAECIPKGIVVAVHRVPVTDQDFMVFHDRQGEFHFALVYTVRYRNLTRVHYELLFPPDTPDVIAIPAEIARSESSAFLIAERRVDYLRAHFRGTDIANGDKTGAPYTAEQLIAHYREAAKYEKLAWAS